VIMQKIYFKIEEILILLNWIIIKWKLDLEILYNENNILKKKNKENKIKK